MGTWLERVLDALFPEECRLCGAPVDAAPWICDRCIDRSPSAPPTVCATCALDVDRAADPKHHRGPLVHAATHYDADGAAAGLALRMLKYDGRRRLAGPLATLLHRRAFPLSPGVLVPVPLHPARLRHRGYNQATLLAHRLHRLTGLPILPAALRRTRDTVAQTHLLRAARLQNLAGAFAASPRLVGARPIILVDDVATTGATLGACANALRAAGAETICAVVVARRVLLSPATGTR